MPTFIARGFMFKIPWGLLQMKQDELLQELLKSKPAENMGQVPAQVSVIKYPSTITATHQPGGS